MMFNFSTNSIERLNLFLPNYNLLDLGYSTQDNTLRIYLK